MGIKVWLDVCIFVPKLTSISQLQLNTFDRMMGFKIKNKIDFLAFKIFLAIDEILKNKRDGFENDQFP